MPLKRKRRAALLACAAMLVASSTAAAAAGSVPGQQDANTAPIPAQETPPVGDPQQAPAATTGDAPPPITSTASNDRQVFTPADFARFAPRTALDMLQQVPGFSIFESEQGRGLGQASGNVLINSARLSSKSDDIQTQLARIPIGNVIRIEIVDGATLDLPGLSGQVANLIVKADSISGQFAWRPNFRAHWTHPRYTLGEVSVSGKAGPVQFEAGLANSGGTGGAGGVTLITNGTGGLIERRFETFRSTYDAPKLSGRATIDLPGSAVATLNAAYQRIYSRTNEDWVRSVPGQVDRERIFRLKADGWNREFGGDIDLRVGPGRLKLIGLDRYTVEPLRQTVIARALDGSPPTGDRYEQTGRLTERIARGEYSWKMLGGDWQLSAEGAFNTLANHAFTATLDAQGKFTPVPFAPGSGGVDEDRYEGLLSYNRALSPKLSLQVVAGAERSTLAQTGANGLTRTFVRPKGSATLTWRPDADFDVSAKLRRRVLQLSFYDFLARVFLDNQNANSGNADLVPQQDWSLEVEANRRFGAWGSTKLRLIGRDVQDYIDVIPIGATGQSVGNIPRARAGAIDWTATIQLDPAGWKGARFDTRMLVQRSWVRDPLTGITRQYSGFTDTLLSVEFRHDIPKSDWAYGGSLEYNHNQPRYRLNEIDRQYEGPVFDALFLEHKDVAGLTVRATVVNLLNARSSRDRTVFAGRRTIGLIDYVETRDRLIGPLFNFSVKGNF